MRILLDHCVPKRLKRLLSEYDVATARGVGFDTLKNGKLLSQAQAAFDVLLTVDRNIKHQQNLSQLPLSIIVMVAVSNRYETLVPYMPEVERVLQTIRRGELVEVHRPGDVGAD